MFPDIYGKQYWSTLFPDNGGASQNPIYFTGYGPAGSAAFVLDLDSDFKLKLSWNTDVIKKRSGTEQRIAPLDVPVQNYSGTAILLDANPRKIRSLLARFASNAAIFQLGLRHEGISIIVDSTGLEASVNPAALALCDWAEIGQRVAVVGLDESSVLAIVQSASGGTITLDTALGNTGLRGATIMPTMPVYLAAQQNFERYQTNNEKWSIEARAAIFDFALPSGELALAGNMAGAILTSRIPGLYPETVQFKGDAAVQAGSKEEFVTTDSSSVIIHYKPASTTMNDIAALFAVSQTMMLRGTYVGTTVLQAGDAFGPTALAGGTASGLAGSGASLTEYLTRPVWARPITVADSGVDSIQALTDIIDLGGIPYGIGFADQADWGRHLMMTSTKQADWQWLKLMLWTIRGCQKKFWLPTWRNDLTYVSGTGPIVVRTDDGGDVFTWYPQQRQYLQIQQVDGTITYAQITAAADNGDGTATLTITSALSGSAVEMISWLELCRLESPDQEIMFHGQGFSYTAIARVVP